MSGLLFEAALGVASLRRNACDVCAT